MKVDFNKNTLIKTRLISHEIKNKPINKSNNIELNDDNNSLDTMDLNYLTSLPRRVRKDIEHIGQINSKKKPTT